MKQLHSFVGFRLSKFRATQARSVPSDDVDPLMRLLPDTVSYSVRALSFTRGFLKNVRGSSPIMSRHNELKQLDIKSRNQLRDILASGRVEQAARRTGKAADIGARKRSRQPKTRKSRRAFHALPEKSSIQRRIARLWPEEYGLAVGLPQRDRQGQQ